MLEEIHYVRNDGTAIAYQIFGEGPVDLVCVPGFISNLIWQQKVPGFIRFIEQLARFSRVIIMDRRGVGLSDRFIPQDPPPLEVIVEDVLAVMDDAGCNSPALFGWQDGALQSLLLAATHPHRISSLITFQANPCAMQKEDWPWGESAQGWEEYLLELKDGWGTRSWTLNHLQQYLPDVSASGDIEWVASYMRLSASPSSAEALERMVMVTDVRHILPLIKAPTLAIYRPDDPNEDDEVQEYLVNNIKDATKIAVPGRDNAPYFGGVDEITAAIQEFILGDRAAPEFNRVLATVFFVDIVNSTSEVESQGDNRWRSVLTGCYEKIRIELSSYRGVEVKTTGDGLVATFDSPARAVKCAMSIRHSLCEIGIDVRTGIHIGEIEISGDDIAGIAVHIGSRISSLADTSEILVTSTVKDIVAGSGLEFEFHGEHVLKGIEEPWGVYRVASANPRV